MSCNDQTILPLDGLEAMPVLPRCEETGQNSDLHLVVYTPEGAGAPVARILTTQARHLFRKPTSFSAPLWMLTLENIARLERRGTIPGGSKAAETIRAWLRYDREATWRELFEAENTCQFELALDDAPGLGLDE